MNNNELFQNMINKSGGKLDRETLQNAAKTHNAEELVKKLSDTDRQKLESILSDKDKLAKVLESPEARMLFKLFGGTASSKNDLSGGGKNG